MDSITETARSNNLFAELPQEINTEIFETLLKKDDFKLERITSHGQSTPEGEWLSQKENEWVVLLSGSARLAFKDKKETICLNPGDHLVIPSGMMHRVDWTTPREKTIWLALHYPASKSVETGLISREEFILRPVKIIRSRRRRKTISAKIVTGILCVYCPQNTPQDFLDKTIQKFQAKFKKQFLKKQLNKEKDLRLVAEELNRKYFQGRLRINSIEYVTDQKSKFGCCNYHKKSIRISHRIADMPGWVRDYVVVHELAHLLAPDHSQSFWDLVSVYKLAERAKGYLMAKGLDDDENEKQ